MCYFFTKVEKVKATVTEGKLSMKEMVRLITDLTDDISAANISHWKKDEMRTGKTGFNMRILALNQITYGACILHFKKYEQDF
jgi:hypothetical protein